MSCLSSARKARINARIAKLEAQVLVLEAALLEASNGVVEYRFDSGEGSQKTIRQDIVKVKKMIDLIESQVESLYKKLNNTGLVNMNLRRKYHGCY